MSKKLTFSKKPTTTPTAAEVDASALDEFVGVQTPAKAKEPTPSEKMKRFTFDVPESLHRRIKSQCAAKGVDMADEMRRLLEERFPAES
jgi:hypothetical protein